MTVNNLPALLSAVAALERERDEAVKGRARAVRRIAGLVARFVCKRERPKRACCRQRSDGLGPYQGDARRFAESLT